MLRSIVKCFLAGVVTVLPLVITVAVVGWVAQTVTGLLGPRTLLGGLLAQMGFVVSPSTAPWIAYAVGWGFVLALIFGLGVLVEFGAKRFVQGNLDRIGRKLPMLGGVYGTVRQMMGMMDKENSELKGMSVVFCTFGGDSGAMFLALLPTPEKFLIGEMEYHAVLIPSAPVPMGGSLIFVPAPSVKQANLSVDAFMSMYVSMGMSAPQFLTAVGAKGGGGKAEGGR